jgi:flagellin
VSQIALSAAVRQNLLSLQSTASLLSTTQNDLATGNKVNSALDDPTSYFTAQGLNNRASDISNLLDGIGNGVQVLQAANTGISSLQSLIDSAKSVANQVLQAPVGYSTKAGVVSAAITNGGTAVTADDLRGLGTLSAGSVTGTAVTAGGASTPATLSTLVSGWNINPAAVLTYNGGSSILFNSGGGTTLGGPSQVLDVTSATFGDVVTALDDVSGHTDAWSLGANGALSVETSGLAITTTGDPNLLIKLGLAGFGATSVNAGGNTTFNPIISGGGGSAPITANSTLASLTTQISTSDTLTANGKTISFNNGAGTSISSTGASIDLSTAKVQDILNAVDTISGAGTGASSVDSSGDIVLKTASSSGLTIGGSALTKLGLSAQTIAPAGLTLSFGAVGSGAATTVTFGDGSNGTVKSLNQLNAALSADNLVASLASSGKLTVQTSNDDASASLPTIGGTAVTNASGAFKASNGAVSTATAVADASAQSTRASLVAQFNNILRQINSTAQDASFNGVNLLNGDTLKLTFNETGRSSLSITGATFNSAGLSLSSLTSGIDFLDNASANKVLNSLNAATSSLRSEASTLGSNLSIVEIRQDFNKNLINVLQTGSSNLTLADTNQEAANSQALSTRQSIAVSALSLSNQSQQGVLQLLR